jgi:hypothetical protein
LAGIAITTDDIDWLILHQANQRIMDSVSDRLKIPSEKVISNVAKYGNTSAVTQATANSVISQTTDLTLVAGSSYTLDEYVFQGGSANSATFYGQVNAQESNEVRISKVVGTITLGLPLVGGTSGTSRIVISNANPEFQPYTGDILYAENIVKTEREDGQAENIKFVVRF